MAVDRRKLSKELDASLPFRELINLSAVVSPEAFITKSGDLYSVISVQPLDPECLEQEIIESVRDRIQGAYRLCTGRQTVTSFFMKSSRPTIDFREVSNRVANEAIRNRQQLLQAKAAGLYSIETFIAVATRPATKSPSLAERLQPYGRHPITALRSLFGLSQRTDILQDQLERDLRAHNGLIQNFLGQTDEILRGQLLTVAEAFRFLRRLYNPNRDKAAAVPLSACTNLDHWVVDSVLECYRDHLRLDEYFVKTLTLKRLPSYTFANMLKSLLEVQADFTIAVEWTVMNPAKAASFIRTRRRHANNTKVSPWSHIGSERQDPRGILYDESKEEIVRQLGMALTGVEVQGLALGTLSLGIVLTAKTLREVEAATAEMMKVIGRFDGALNEETYNGLEAFLATGVGGYHNNHRTLTATSENHADLLPLFQPAAGESVDAFLGQPCLATFETEQRTLFSFSYHAPEVGVGHTLVLGATGSGKSFLMNFFIVNLLQYKPYIFIFDKGGSYRWVTELVGGSYILFRPDLRSVTISPFVLEPTPANLEFLFLFIKLLIESGGYRLPDIDAREIFEAIRAIYILEPEQRRLLTVLTTIARHIAQHLRPWVEGEQYGAWFDHPPSRDTFRHAPFQCIDFEGMDRLGVVREPLMFYLLHRQNEIVIDPELATIPKVAIVDEGESLFRQPIIQDYVTEAVRTWRKKNASLFLSTQSLQDLTAPGLRALIENCPTKLLLSTPRLDKELAQDLLGLNSVEIEKVRQLAPKRQFLLKREKLSKVLNLNVDPKSYWLFTTNPYEAKRRQELVEKVGLEAALEILAGETK